MGLISSGGEVNYFSGGTSRLARLPMWQLVYNVTFHMMEPSNLPVLVALPGK